MDLIAKRFECAQEYLEILEGSFKLDWETLYVNVITHSNWVYRLSAIHPRHYQDYVRSEPHCCPVRGMRGMAIDGGAKVGGCQCRLVWGYDCSFDKLRLEADHLFPYSFGGPSAGQNKIYLCTLHNQAKGSDIHLYQWELGEPVWLSAVLERVRRQFITSR